MLDIFLNEHSITQINNLFIFIYFYLIEMLKMTWTNGSWHG